MFLPRPDGNFIPLVPSQQLVREGKYARVPGELPPRASGPVATDCSHKVVTGDCDDEGTLFSILGQTNVTTEAQGNQYLQQFFFPSATPEEAASIFALYPSGECRP